jgi:riboflavin kinase/FMN adenylyltransferase
VVVDEKIALPTNGVYAVYFYENGIRHAGAGNLGVRPTFDQQTRSLEIHLLDYSGDLYGQTVVVEFVQRLRPEVRFPGVSDLVAQIGRDIENARDVLA